MPVLVSLHFLLSNKWNWFWKMPLYFEVLICWTFMTLRRTISKLLQVNLNPTKSQSLAIKGNTWFLAFKPNNFIGFLFSIYTAVQQSTCGVDDKIDAGIIGLQSPRKLNLWEGLFRITKSGTSQFWHFICAVHTSYILH